VLRTPVLLSEAFLAHDFYVYLTDEPQAQTQVVFEAENDPSKLRASTTGKLVPSPERECCIDNLLVRIHFIIVMIRWTGLTPWDFEFPFPGSTYAIYPAP